MWRNIEYDRDNHKESLAARNNKKMCKKCGKLWFVPTDKELYQDIRKTNTKYAILVGYDRLLKMAYFMAMIVKIVDSGLHLFYVFYFSFLFFSIFYF